MPTGAFRQLILSDKQRKTKNFWSCSNHVFKFTRHLIICSSWQPQLVMSKTSGPWQLTLFQRLHTQQSLSSDVIFLKHKKTHGWKGLKGWSCMPSSWQTQTDFLTFSCSSAHQIYRHKLFNFFFGVKMLSVSQIPANSDTELWFSAKLRKKSEQLWASTHPKYRADLDFFFRSVQSLTEILERTYHLEGRVSSLWTHRQIRWLQPWTQVCF